jgi:hypothetical protein
MRKIGGEREREQLDRRLQECKDIVCNLGAANSIMHFHRINVILRSNLACFGNSRNLHEFPTKKLPAFFFFYQWV